MQNNSCDDDVIKAWRIFLSNAMEVGLEDNAGLEEIAGLYPTLSRINHSCQCNTYQSCSGLARTVEIIAGRDLAEGEEVTLNYLGPTSILMGREERQARLSKGRVFTSALSRGKNYRSTRTSGACWLASRNTSWPLQGLQRNIR